MKRYNKNEFFLFFLVLYMSVLLNINTISVEKFGNLEDSNLVLNKVTYSTNNLELENSSNTVNNSIVKNMVKDSTQLKDIKKDSDSDNDSLPQDLLKQLGVDEKSLTDSKSNNSSNENYKKNDVQDDSKLDWLLTHSCAEIKKFGREKEYCLKIKPNDNNELQKDKLLDSTLKCLKNFCSDCCVNNSINSNNKDECISSCKEEKKFFTNNSPAEIFKSVCEYKNMQTTFDGYCSFFKESGDNNEYNKCFKNFCFDCCAKEIGSENSNWDPDTSDVDKLTEVDKMTSNDSSIIAKCMQQCFPASEFKISSNSDDKINSMKNILPVNKVNKENVNKNSNNNATNVKQYNINSNKNLDQKNNKDNKIAIKAEIKGKNSISKRKASQEKSSINFAELNNSVEKSKQQDYDDKNNSDIISEYNALTSKSKFNYLLFKLIILFFIQLN